jgi:hypothetical protein
MRTIKTVEQFRNFVGNNGRLFSVTFIKKDGSERKMTARLGVKSYLTGGGAKYNAEDRNNIVVFSMSDKGYRTINIDALLKVKANGKVIEKIQA